MSLGDNLHEMSKNVCLVKIRKLYFGDNLHEIFETNKKTIISLSAADFFLPEC